MKKNLHLNFGYGVGWFGTKKHHLGPQNDLGSLGPKKLPNWKNYFELVGIGGWPSISTPISPPPLGGNFIHCVEFSDHMGKLLLNLTLGEPLALVE
jgi:hypothetical protein